MSRLVLQFKACISLSRGLRSLNTLLGLLCHWDTFHQSWFPIYYKKEPLFVGHCVSKYVSCKHLRIDLGEGQPKLLSHSFYVNTFVMRIGHVCIQLDFVACLTMDLSVLMCQDFVPQEKLASGFYKRTCYLPLHLKTILFVLLSHCLQHFMVWHSSIWTIPRRT